MITINNIELASNLAHERTLAECIKSNKIVDEHELYVDFNAEVLTYKDNIQDIFNDYYDYYLNEIENTKI